MACTRLARDRSPNETAHVRSAVAADAATVYRIARGDKTALAELYQLHGPRLLAFAQRLLGIDYPRCQTVRLSRDVQP